ncbi:hypothetical protein [Edaphobacter sp.]|uniref:hypothetical protein n=1 Tax=Edaphobacter sp. TaxID=1934404 RepID=UPI0039C87C0E
MDRSWEGQRDADGVLQPNPAKFGDMKQLGDYIHSKDLKFSGYSLPGPTIRGGFVASYGLKGLVFLYQA